MCIAGHQCQAVYWARRVLRVGQVFRGACHVQGGDGELEDGYDEGVRHAETPELAREALADCAVLIFKGQVTLLLQLKLP